MIQKKRTTKKLDLSHLPEGVYFDEKAFGKVHLMEVNKSIFGVDEYVYKGKIHKGRCGFLGGLRLSEQAPRPEDRDHGYTLEGLANEIFEVDNALVCHNEGDNRTYCYTNSKSALKFVGDPSKNYELYVRIYENAYGINNYRWVVIWAQYPEAK